MARREFSEKIKDQEFARAEGKCRVCGIAIGTKAKHYDHILPDALGGRADLANCALLCEPCHKDKTAHEDIPRIRKADRQRKAHVGAHTPKQKLPSRPFPSAGKERREKLPLPPRREMFK